MACEKPTVRILFSKPAILAKPAEIELEALLQHAVEQSGTCVWQSIIIDTNDQKCTLWIAPVTVPEQVSAQLHDAVAVCAQFVSAALPGPGIDHITFCFGNEEIGERGVFHLVILRTPPDIDIELLNSRISPTSNLRQMTSTLVSTVSQQLSSLYSMFTGHQRYHLLSSGSGSKTPFPSVFPQGWKQLTILSTILASILILLIFAIIPLFSSSSPEIYLRYNTAGSIGPNYQLRLTHLNATTWARKHLVTPNNPQDYTLRLDDQALIPTSLYTPEEEKYQAWYRARYPHLLPIVENKTYLRPGWLGSLEVGESLLWDSKFHYAHCLLALRRYWWAKESGRHVCGRDIDYGHIEHCLDYLDDRVFTEGPMDELWEDGQRYYLWWQTKACFDE